MSEPNDHSSGIRLLQLRLAGSVGRDLTYGVDFRDDSLQSYRPVSIIAGPSQTGKTSAIEFVLYCLGAEHYPEHPEIVSAVRSSLIDVQLGGSPSVIERDALGRSRFATVWQQSLSSLLASTPAERAGNEVRFGTESTTDPESLSQFLLAACHLDGVGLPVAPKKEESRTHTLSIRDLLRVLWLPNERLDSKNLLFEHSNYMVAQKFRQTVDSIFDVHDETASSIASELREASEAARQAARDAENLKAFVQAEHPLGELVLETDRADAELEINRLEAELANANLGRSSLLEQEEDLRTRLFNAERQAQEAALRLRDRQSLLRRLASLKGQYADEKKKLTFLKEAEQLFDPLHVTNCPACFSALEHSPELTDGKCSLCGNEASGDLTLTSRESTLVRPRAGSSGASSAAKPRSTDGDSAAASYEVDLLGAELEATSRRLEDLSDYWARLDRDAEKLARELKEKEEEASEAAAALDAVVEVPAPFLARRDDLSRRLNDAQLRLQSAEAGLRMWARVRVAEESAQRLDERAKRLRLQRRAQSVRPDRMAVVRSLSERFGRILEDFGYPKLSEPRIDERYMPHVRGMNYTSASSGGQTLISLAWYLSLLEVSYESSPRAPGLLMIDSPQKNLGHAAGSDDPDFADSRLVENFYRHIVDWTGHAGAGAQIIVVDNSPPESVQSEVVVRYTRNTEKPPYGLIVDDIE